MMKSIQSWIPSDRNVQTVMCAGVLVLAVVALGSGFMWYRWQREQAASHAFVQALSKLEQATSEQSQQAWDEAEKAFAYGYDDYASSSMAGYFLAYVADIMYQQGKHDKACHKLEQAVDYMPRGNTLYYSYALRLALMQRDSTDKQLQEQGEKLIEQLKDDTANPLRDMALYYDGLHYFNQLDRTAAWTAWQPLLDPNTFDQNSAWASRAHAKLAYYE